MCVAGNLEYKFHNTYLFLIPLEDLYLDKNDGCTDIAYYKIYVYYKH